MTKYQPEKQIVVEAAKKMAAKGLVLGTSGNVSLRLPPAKGRPLLAITPSAKHYDSLMPADIQVLDFSGKKIEGDRKPSVETDLHIKIYRARASVNAIIHTHSVYASAAAVAGLEIPPILEDQVAYLGGAIKLAAYAPGGSPELAGLVLKALGDRSGVLLANHGALGTGRTMEDALTACEFVEKTAKIYILALLSGQVNHLPAAGVKTCKEIYDKTQTL
jgi:ribulose-5-phosphate 4-epimerase/fuculose-1-phosphate aldolase